MKRTINRLLAFIGLAALPFTPGCYLCSCNHVLPTLEWYWSADAIACRKEHRMEREWERQRTNTVKRLSGTTPGTGTAQPKE